MMGSTQAAFVGVALSERPTNKSARVATTSSDADSPWSQVSHTMPTHRLMRFLTHSFVGEPRTAWPSHNTNKVVKATLSPKILYFSRLGGDMKVSKTELSARYAQYPNDRLVGILFEKDQYTAEAVQIAHEELLQRKVNLQEEIDDYLDQKENERIRVEIAARIQLSFWEKILFFFLWIAPLFGALRRNYAEDGMEQKRKQSSFFSRIGFGCFIITGILSVLATLSSFQSLSLLIILFMLTLYADKKRMMPDK